MIRLRVVTESLHNARAPLATAASIYKLASIHANIRKTLLAGRRIP